MNALVTTCVSVNSEYFLNYELINKYKIFNLFFVPRVEKASLIISVLDLINNAFDTISTAKNPEVKLYVLLYILFLRTPIITLNSSIISKRSKISSTSYYLKTILTNSISISELFISIFFENWHKIKKGGLLFEAKNSIEKNSTNLFYRFKIFITSITFFKNLSAIFDLIFDFKEIFFYITVRLKHPINILKTSGIKSFPFFWIND